MKYWFYSISAFIVLLALGSILALHSYGASGPLAESKTVIFPPATHFTEIADTLGNEGIINYPLLFKIMVVAQGDSGKFKAGEYAFPPHISAREVASMMAAGKTVTHHLTIPEGLMTSEIIELVKHADGLDGEIILDLHEGDLLPETYNYSRGDKRNDILTRMHHAMEKTLADAWAGRAEHLPYKTPLQALTMASIVEKETSLASERSRVAGVYVNRLNKNMLLQADPTTVYAVTQGKYKLDRPLSVQDLALESPYNTYRVPGLPPTPIANPGKASIIAALHPVASDELYFVATGTGGHNFARTLQEHEANVQKYREQKKAP